MIDLKYDYDYSYAIQFAKLTLSCMKLCNCAHTYNLSLLSFFTKGLAFY